LEGIDLLNTWYELIMESSLQAGAIIYDGKGNKKYFFKNSINIVTHNKSKKTNKSNYSP